MVSPYLLRRPRSFAEAAAARAGRDAVHVDEEARQAILRALGRFRQRPVHASDPPKAARRTPGKQDKTPGR